MSSMCNTPQQLSIPYDVNTDEYLNQFLEKNVNAYTTPKRFELATAESSQTEKTPGAANYLTP